MSDKRKIEFKFNPHGAKVAETAPDAPELVRLEWPNERLSFACAKVVIINGIEFVRREKLP